MMCATPKTVIALMTARPSAEPVRTREGQGGVARGEGAPGRGEGSAVDGDGATAPVDGIDATGMAAWFAANVPTAVPPLTYERIAGGHSNLPYPVNDQGGRERG